MSGIKVNFYESVSDGRLKYAVIAARYNGKWVWCRHRERATFEIPGGHREAGENISDTARRELYEETGAVRYDIFPSAFILWTETARKTSVCFILRKFMSLKLSFTAR